MVENEANQDQQTDSSISAERQPAPKVRGRGRRLLAFGPKAAAESVSVAPVAARAPRTPPVPEPVAQVPLDGDVTAEPELLGAPHETAPAAIVEPAQTPDAVAEPAAPKRIRPPSFQVLFQAPPALPESATTSAQPDRAFDDDDDDQDVQESSDASGRRPRRRSRNGRLVGGPAGGTARDTDRGAGDRRGNDRVGTGRDDDHDDRDTEVVGRTRPQRELITEPQRLKGSTRLEAKRQRRRDGRDAGRRRTVVTEAEFLARREAVDRVMIVKSTGDRIEIGVLEDGILAEHYVAKSQNVSLIGNVYLGRVQNVLPSMEAAFVDIGRGRNAVLYSGEVDWDAASDRMADKGTQARRIELALKSGDKVLVQVTKDPIGHKGARLTSAISLPGRFLVYVPNGSMNGISRKLPDTERTRLKRILKDALPDSAGVIVRTAAEGAAEEQLIVDVQRLTNQWAEIEHLVETASAPSLLHGEPDLLVKIVRDVFNEDFAKLIIAGDEARATIERYVGQIAPELLDRIERWDGKGDVFAAHRVNEQIEKALDHKVWLPSGGSLVIDRTEAMTVVDVNTGKFVGSGGNLEETVTKNNLEAAEEIVRQLRLRDIGGIIVIDFIDMVLETNRDLVLRRLVECLSRDRTKHQVAEVTSLGLVQMTRKRLGIGLAESMSDEQQASDNRGDGQGRRRRGGGSQQQQQQRPTGTTHAITSDAKNALAQIAGATIVPAARAADLEAPVAAATLDAGATEAVVVAVAEAIETASVSTAMEQELESMPEPVQKAPRRASRSRRAQSQTPAAEATPQPADAEAPAAPEPVAPKVTAPKPATEPAVAIELPIAPVVERPAARVPDADAAQILDSVLGALPEPKRAGEGRRSRRVSTPALTPRKTD